MRWERRRIFSRESFTARRPFANARRSQDDPLLAGHLLLEHLEHLRVGDVRALHLRGVLDQDLADLFVESVLDLELVGDDLGDPLHDAGLVVHLELLLGDQSLHDLAGDELDLVVRQPHPDPSISDAKPGFGLASSWCILGPRTWPSRSSSIPSSRTSSPGCGTAGPRPTSSGGWPGG